MQTYLTHHESVWGLHVSLDTVWRSHASLDIAGGIVCKSALGMYASQGSYVSLDTVRDCMKVSTPLLNYFPALYCVGKHLYELKNCAVLIHSLDPGPLSYVRAIHEKKTEECGIPFSSFSSHFLPAIANSRLSDVQERAWTEAILIHFFPLAD